MAEFFNDIETGNDTFLRLGLECGYFKEGSDIKMD